MNSSRTRNAPQLKFKKKYRHTHTHTPKTLGKLQNVPTIIWCFGWFSWLWINCVRNAISRKWSEWIRYDSTIFYNYALKPTIEWQVYCFCSFFVFVLNLNAHPLLLKRHAFMFIENVIVHSTIILYFGQCVFEIRYLLNFKLSHQCWCNNNSNVITHESNRIFLME